MCVKGSFIYCLSWGRQCDFSCFSLLVHIAFKSIWNVWKSIQSYRCLDHILIYPFFPSSLTIPVLNMLLNELLCVSKVPPGVKHVDLDLSTLPPTTAMAVIIYNRWWVRSKADVRRNVLHFRLFILCYFSSIVFTFVTKKKNCMNTNNKEYSECF